MIKGRDIRDIFPDKISYMADEEQSDIVYKKGDGNRTEDEEEYKCVSQTHSGIEGAIEEIDELLNNAHKKLYGKDSKSSDGGKFLRFEEGHDYKNSPFINIKEEKQDIEDFSSQPWKRESKDGYLVYSDTQDKHIDVVFKNYLQNKEDEKYQYPMRADGNLSFKKSSSEENYTSNGSEDNTIDFFRSENYTLYLNFSSDFSFSPEDGTAKGGKITVRYQKRDRCKSYSNDYEEKTYAYNASDWPFTFLQAGS